jgi:dephospho-CoA kinase
MDRVAVVACSELTQINRLLAKRGLSRQIATRMIRAQIPLDTKMAKADYVIWNDSRPEHLREQANALGDSLKAQYG